MVIGNHKVKDEVTNENITFINENELGRGLTFERIKYLMMKRGGDLARTGWYFQQFIKMQYSFYTNDEYYLLWDADTIPVKKIEFFYNDKMLFNLKTEMCKPYFDLINKLFDSKIKCINKSFISEGMVIKTCIMRELIDSIESKNNLEGILFYEKIMNLISSDIISKSGFSEFETYGNYVYTYYPNLFKYRPLNTQRHGMFYYGRIPEYSTLCKSSYDTVTFEKYDGRKNRLLRALKRIYKFLRIM